MKEAIKSPLNLEMFLKREATMNQEVILISESEQESESKTSHCELNTFQKGSKSFTTPTADLFKNIYII